MNRSAKEILMILDTLSSSARYEGLGPRFALAFQWLRSIDPSTLPDGKTAIDGTDVYVLAQRGLTKPLDQVKWEAHRNYADIQYIVSGSEAMFWEALEKTTLGEYNPEKDFQALEVDSWVDLEVPEGQFAVFFPSDAHRPGILIPGADPVYKLVVKVRV
jgi:biofilm protein TabA